jgi:glucose/arabinose dehydrogenase
MRKWILLALLVMASMAMIVRAAPNTQATSAPDPAQFRFVDVAGGFTRPLNLTHTGDDRLFVVEQDGRIKIIQNGTVLPTAFLDVSSLVSRGGSEQGLLGLAFHPNYAQNGWFFINYTDTAGDTVVARYQVSSDPNRADANSRTVVLTVDQPYANHNGGHMLFGPDGYLYIGMGDGGSGGDPQNRAQNPATLLGKMLRINVNQIPYTVPTDNPFVSNTAYKPEIWAVGLRNPWRFSFDRATGDLYIGDVGQSNWEEVNFQPAGVGGLNYGWKVYEGTHPFGGGTLANATMPFAEYNHGSGCSVTGGYVYRGASMPDMQGVYVYGDFCSGIVWTAYRNSAGTWQAPQFMDTNYSISSFGEDRNGELYIVDYNGKVVRFEQILAAATTTPIPPTATPVTPSETPIMPSETPGVPSETPIMPSETPGVPSETPIMPSETAVVPSPTSTTEPPPDTPLLRVDVNPASAQPGEVVTVALNLFNVTNVYGLQVECIVNPAVLTGGTHIDGEFNAGNSYFVDQGFQNGRWVVAASRLKPSTPINGSVTAFSLGYTVAGGGDTAVECSALAVDPNGLDVALTVQPGLFTGAGSPDATPTLVIPTETPIPPTPIPATPTETPLPPIVTPEPTNSGSIQGVVAYQNRPDNAGITVKLLAVDGTEITQVVTNANGGYQFTDVAVGVYQVQLSAPQHLSVLKTDVLVESEGQAVDLGMETLRAGDTDDNGVIDLTDAALVGANFGVSVPPAPSSTDLTGDGLVNISDLALVGSNYNPAPAQ